MGTELPPLPDRFNIAAACVDRWADAGHGERPAIRSEAQVLTYRGLQQTVDRLGSGLRSLGLGKGDRFLIRLPGGVPFYASFLAGLKIGAVAIPTPELLRERELRHIVNVAEVQLAITSDALAEPIRALREELDVLKEVVCLDGAKATEVDFDGLVAVGTPDMQAADTTPQDPAFILFSSGTTGVPKGIAHAHRAFNIGVGDPVGTEGMGLTPDDIVLHPHDPAWSYSLGCGFLFPLAEGASIVASTSRIAPADILDRVQEHSVTILACVPTYYRAVLAIPDSERGKELRSLRHCLSAGEPLTTNTFKEWERRIGVPILDHIGQGETSMFCANKPGMKIKPGSVGTPLSGYRVAVIDGDGNEIVDEIGHLVIAEDNPGLFYDYLHMPEKWSETHRNGWYHTGDLARRDDDGYFWYVSRSDDLINSRGYSISPAEVEDILVDHPAVLEAGVVGHGHAQWGEIVTAYVSLQPEFTPSPELEAELGDHVRRELAPFKAPKKWVFLQELPKTSTGKILRRELRRTRNE